MRELLLAFIFALIVGSIINGMQQKPTSSAPVNGGQGTANSSEADSNTNSNISANGERRDFPAFTSFATVNNNNFEQMVLKSSKPVFIDCYVPNNQACDQMIPLVAAVAKDREGAILMARMNVMDNILLAHRYEISSVPTFLLFDQGVLIGKLSGVLSQDRLESMIASLPRAEHTNEAN